MSLRITGGVRAALISALLAHTARAGVILEVVGPTENYAELGGPRGTNYEQALGVDWTLTAPFGGVVIRPLIKNFSSSTEQITAWLTTAVGPGTSPADPTQLAYAAIDLPAGYEGYLTLFAPMDLAPAHYFLILYGPADTTQLSWELGEFTAATHAASGVIPGSYLMVTNIANPPMNTLYPPASGFAYDCCRADKALFQIAQVPEPRTGLPIVVAVILTAVRSKRRIYAWCRYTRF